MMLTAPPLTIAAPPRCEDTGQKIETIRDAQDVVAYVSSVLQDSLGWQGQKSDAGQALVQLFGRLCELVIIRLNQVPDKHFLAFLNAAGVDLLPPRAASADLTFTLAEKGPAFVHVPAGAQAATLQTEAQPEIVFETERDLTVVASKLVRCIAFDPLCASDRTAQANGPAFPAFSGEHPRERILYLGDDELFSFPDAASRENATVTLSFEFQQAGSWAADSWSLSWLYWDGTKWADLVTEGCSTIKDNTGQFIRSGTVELSHLPELVATDVDGLTGLWIARSLKGGTGRDNLPILSSIQGEQSIAAFTCPAAKIDAAFCAVNAGTSFVPLDTTGEFFPLGQHPARLDAFYLRVDEAFSKPDASVTLVIDLEGVTGTPLDTSNLDKLIVVWEYFSREGWMELGQSKWESRASKHLGFVDGTNAFTQTGECTIKNGLTNDPPFAKTTINGQEGYWVRARLTAGGYDEPGHLIQDVSPKWIPPVSHTPLVRSFAVTYTTDSRLLLEKGAIGRCRSQVDGMWRTHDPNGAAFAPFSAAEEGPALYLGFAPAFPAEKWIQLLIDVVDAPEATPERPLVFWEYWNGRTWAALRASDGTQGLRQRGYLGFFGPADHQPSIEFGQQAYWLRVRPHRAPIAEAGEDQEIKLPVGEVSAVVTLDTSGSRVFDRQTPARYTWRLLSSSPLVADAGPDQSVKTSTREATVTLDASGSRSLHDNSIVNYIWSVKPDKTSDATILARPYVKAIRANTTPALNATTVKDETVGSSDGKPTQVFTLVRKPALPDIQLAVQEPDRPPEDELRALQRELPPSEAPLALGEARPGQGPWVRWNQVPDFYSSGATSRHFVLDAIAGQVRFGDGAMGMIPPPGRNNIKALVYRTHNGAAGNVGAGSIAVLRNPTGDLAQIKRVANLEAAAGGSDAETVEEVKQRGPQTLKHRQRGVTIEDFAWLAREASAEVAHAACLPGRNAQGQIEPGWATVVITPDNADAKPTPTPGLLRHVQAYLEQRSLANLAAASHIVVKGPEYVEATVLAQVTPTQPEKADEVSLAVLRRLEEFLHPLRGGPLRKGWELGRDVYLSEVYAEIEAVPGVDHVKSLRLASSMQQFRLNLLKPARAPFDVPVDSQVSTFDGRIKLVLAEPVVKGDPLASLAVYGLKVGDVVSVVGADNRVLKDNLRTVGLTGDAVTFDQVVMLPSDADALLSVDQRLRLPLDQEVPKGIALEASTVAVQGFAAGNADLCIVAGAHRDPTLEFLVVEDVLPCQDRIVVPEGHLVYSGSHHVEMVLE